DCPRLLALIVSKAASCLRSLSTQPEGHFKTVVPDIAKNPSRTRLEYAGEILDSRRAAREDRLLFNEQGSSLPSVVFFDFSSFGLNVSSANSNNRTLSYQRDPRFGGRALGSRRPSPTSHAHDRFRPSGTAQQ